MPLKQYTLCIIQVKHTCTTTSGSHFSPFGYRKIRNSKFNTIFIFCNLNLLTLTENGQIYFFKWCNEASLLGINEKVGKWSPDVVIEIGLIIKLSQAEVTTQLNINPFLVKLQVKHMSHLAREWYVTIITMLRIVHCLKTDSGTNCIHTVLWPK